MKIKTINTILVILALVLAVVGILLCIKDDSTIIVICRIPEKTISDFSLLLAPLLLVVSCIIELIRRIKEHEPRKSLFVVGVMLFSIPLVFFGKNFLDDYDAYHLVNKVESPDGENTIYYYDTILVNKYTDKRTDGAAVLKRTGFFEYEEAALIPDFDEDDIEWTSDHAWYKLWILDYSTYGD
ncbi:MAG: hypothetical protein IKK47_03790 [Ruminococcus sp.]|nr:hypothetical protein [Ruminococcus sp.]